MKGERVEQLDLNVCLYFQRFDQNTVFKMTRNFQ